MQLFFTQGFEGTTAAQIAERAEVSERTFFRYFPVKAAVVFPRHEPRLRAFRASLADSQAPTPFARVREAVLSVADDYVIRAEMEWRTWDLVQSSEVLTAYELGQDRQWIHAMQAALGEPWGRARGLSAFDARVVANALIGAMRATLGEWFDSRGRKDLHALGQRAMTLLEAGASGPVKRR